MSSPLNGYALANHFRKVRHRFNLTSLDADLFYELVAVCNDEGWPEVFQLSNPRLYGAVGCTEKGMIPCRERLKAAGLLAFLPGTNRNPSHYSFTISQPLLEVRVKGENPASKSLPETLPEVSDSDAKPLPEHLPGHLPEVSVTAENDAKHLPEHLPQHLPEVSPLYKEQTKTKTLSSSRRDGSEMSEPENDVAFEPFWDAYAKKVDREKSARLWAKLTPAQRVAAFAAVPAYVAQWPVVKYRKNPLTWLNGKCWQDEGLPADKPAPAPGFSAAPTPAPRPIDTSSVLDPDAVAANQAREEAAMRQRIADRQQRQAIPA